MLGALLRGLRKDASVAENRTVLNPWYLDFKRMVTVVNGNTQGPWDLKGFLGIVGKFYILRRIKPVGPFVHYHCSCPAFR